MEITSFHRRYRGRRAFVIGNGPSLERTPLDELQGEYTFAMNRIALIYGRVRWRPSFFVCPTINVARPDWRRDVLTSLDLGIPSFIWDRLKEQIPPRSNVIYIHCTHGDDVAKSAPDEWWSFDIATRVCKFGSSLLVALQIAVYMGFNPIYLLGCDLGFRRGKGIVNLADRGVNRLISNKSVLRVLYGLARRGGIIVPDLNHFDPSYGTPGFPPDTLNLNMIAAHNLALRVTKRVGVQIYNATLGGELEVYPRVNLDHTLRGESIHDQVLESRMC